MLEIVGEVVQMGTMDHGETGITLKVSDDAFIELIGLSEGDIMQMPNVMYERVRITIERIIE